MKKVKMIVSAVAVLAIVSSALAFTKKAGQPLFVRDSATGECSIPAGPHIIDANGTTLQAKFNTPGTCQTLTVSPNQ